MPTVSKACMRTCHPVSRAPLPPFLSFSDIHQKPNVQSRPTQRPTLQPTQPTQRPTLQPTASPIILSLPTGSNVTQTFDNSNAVPVASVTFTTVVSAGATTLTQLTPASPGYVALPAGFSLGGTPIYYDIATTANYSGAIQVCLNYPALAPGSSPPKLLHYTGGTWKDITTSTNPGTRTVCGTASSLSPFTLGYDVSGSAMSNPHLVGANGRWGVVIGVVVEFACLVPPHVIAFTFPFLLCFCFPSHSTTKSPRRPLRL